ncbi:hypothetical protein GCM10009535_09770 [Streptomyces thermocarboxydovorans]|uniref:Mannosylglycerate hydrolase MGH1-like glycoside hydrolase domain-containing protein n=1 Tax=Streptomyces thermocarboxydovorans TaxID=59298 RepID=A0ABN1HAQ0_9ACTN
MIERGLRQYRLLADAVAGAVDSGFAEYVDPFTGEARGTRGFAWTAALALDLAVTAVTT